MKISINRILKRTFLYVGVIVVFFVYAFPLLWMVSTSFKPSGEMFIYPPRFFTSNPVFSHYIQLFKTTAFLTYFKNSLIIAGAVISIVIPVASLGGYSLTRTSFRGRGICGRIVLFVYMFAPIMIVIPMFILMNAIGLANTHFALILAHITFSLPFSLWLMRSYFEGIPHELEEAAMVDGTTKVGALFRIILPLSLPGIVAISVFAFILSWNDFIFAFILITSRHLKTLPVGVQDLYRAAIIDWGLLMCAGVMITIPALIFFVAVHKFLLKGFGPGAVKG